MINHSPTLPLFNAHFNTDMSASLILKSIIPNTNRFRQYKIHIASEVIQRPVFVVKLSWGRIGHVGQQKSLVCPNKEKLDKLLKAILRTRQRHHYQLAFKTPNFPQYDILKEIPSFQKEKHILTLF